MILAKEAIIEEYEWGNIVIDPFNPEMVKENSVDIHIADVAWIQSPFPDQENRANTWDSTVYVRTDEDSDSKRYYHKIIGTEESPFLLEAGNLYLFPTNEKFGTAPGSNIVSEVKAKSTTGRFGLTVSLCAGMGDVGYNDRWILEVRPVNDTLVYPFSCLGQVVFTRTTNTDGSYPGKDRYIDENGHVRFFPKPIKRYKPSNKYRRSLIDE